MLEKYRAKTLISKFETGTIRQNSDTMHELLAIGKPAVKPLIAALKHFHPQVIYESIRTLGHLGDPDAIHALEKLNDHVDPEVRKRASVAIEQVKQSDRGKTKEHLIVELQALRKRSLESIRKSEWRYRMLAENTTDVIWSTNLDLKPTYASPSIKKLTQYNPEEWIRKPLQERMTLASVKMAKRILKEEYEEILKNGGKTKRARTLEIEFIRRDGSTVWCEVIVNFLYDLDDRPISIIGVSRDISERRIIEQRLRNSEETTRELLNAMTNIAILADLKGNLLALNSVAANSLGGTTDDLVGVNVFTLLPPDVAHARRQMMNKVISTGESIRFKDERNGKHFENHFFPLCDTKGNVCCVAVYANDISEHIIAEKKLRSSRDRLEMQYQDFPVPTFTWKKVAADFVLVNCNKAARKITQDGVYDYIGIKGSELYSNQPDILRELHVCYEKRTRIRREMSYYFRSTDENKRLDVSYNFVEPDLVMVHAMDVTEIREAERNILLNAI